MDISQEYSQRVRLIRKAIEVSLIELAYLEELEDMDSSFKSSWRGIVEDLLNEAIDQTIEV